MHSHRGNIPDPNPVTAWRAIRNLSNPLALLSHKRLHKRNQFYLCPNDQAWHLASRLPHQRLPGQARMEGRP